MKLSMTTEIGERFWTPAQALCEIARAGFDCADYSLQVHPAGDAFWRGETWKEEAERLRAAACMAGISFAQTHAPFPSSAEDAAEEKHIFTAIEKAVRLTGRLGCPYIVVHPIIPMTLDYAANREKIFAMNRAFFQLLAQPAREANVTVAIENMFRYDRAAGAYTPTFCSGAEELAELVDGLDGPFAACLDTGHANLNGYRPGDMARLLGGRLRVLHVHDNAGLEDEHTAPYLGTVDWIDFCAALREIEFAGAFSFETIKFEAAMPAGAYPQAQALLCALGRQLAALCEK